MPQPAIPRLYAPLAMCALFALGACLDHSLPLTGPKQVRDTEVTGPEVLPVEPDGGHGGNGKPGSEFDRLPIKERFDSSLAAMRALKARSNGAYAYATSRVSITGMWDSTRVSWSEGNSKMREVWYVLRDWDHQARKIHEGHFTEYYQDIGSHPQGSPALSLDSLYETCRAHLPADTGFQKWFSVDSNRILRQCGSYRGACMDDCPPQVDLRWVEWNLPAVQECLLIAPRVERDTILLIER